MAVTVATVRSRVAAALAAVSGWTQSTAVGGDQWPQTGEGEQAQHKHFAVTCPASTPWSRGDSYTGRTTGAGYETRTRVDWRYRLRVDAQANDYDSALDAEDDLVAASLGSSSDGGLRLVEVTSVRRLLQDSAGRPVAVWGILTFSAIHQIDRS